MLKNLMKNQNIGNNLIIYQEKENDPNVKQMDLTDNEKEERIVLPPERMDSKKGNIINGNQEEITRDDSTEKKENICQGNTQVQKLVEQNPSKNEDNQTKLKNEGKENKETEELRTQREDNMIRGMNKDYLNFIPILINNLVDKEDINFEYFDYQYKKSISKKTIMKNLNRKISHYLVLDNITKNGRQPDHNRNLFNSKVNVLKNGEIGKLLDLTLRELINIMINRKPFFEKEELNDELDGIKHLIEIYRKNYKNRDTIFFKKIYYLFNFEIYFIIKQQRKPYKKCYKFRTVGIKGKKENKVHIKFPRQFGRIKIAKIIADILSKEDIEKFKNSSIIKVLEKDMKNKYKKLKQKKNLKSSIFNNTKIYNKKQFNQINNNSNSSDIKKKSVGIDSSNDTINKDLLKQISCVSSNRFSSEVCLETKPKINRKRERDGKIIFAISKQKKSKKIFTSQKIETQILEKEQYESSTISLDETLSNKNENLDIPNESIPQQLKGNNCGLSLFKKNIFCCVYFSNTIGDISNDPLNPNDIDFCTNFRIKPKGSDSFDKNKDSDSLNNHINNDINKPENIHMNPAFIFADNFFKERTFNKHVSCL